ncbi:surface lipoprotein assembly modifier [Sphingomonas gei]|nr:surface lipoprotein assembly modifier [Sphingomonas gei]
MASALAPIPVYAQAGTPGSAAGDDTRLRLDDGIDRRETDREREVLKGSDDLDAVPSTIVIDGHTYTVSNNVNEMGEALYVSVVRRQWADVRRFLKAYLALDHHDPMLVLYAQGALARQEKDFVGAERFYRKLLALQPDFLPGRLELGRILFENHKDRDALATFRQARAELAGDGEKVAGVRKTVDAFINGLNRRGGWQGSIAIGPEYSDNLNQSSASYTCLLAGADGSCLIDRKVPDPIKAPGINLEGTISRRVPLGGRGGILSKAVVFGDVFPGNGRYSQTSLSTQIGYDHQSARASYTISPTFDLGSYGHHLLYTAWGVRAEGLLNLSQVAALRLELDHKTFDYKQPAYKDYGGGQTEAYLTGWYVLGHSWTLFGGPDFVDKSTDDPTNSFRQYGFRAGLNKPLGKGLNLLLLGSFHWRDYGAYSELLGAKRDDAEQDYVSVIKVPALSFAGLTPSILVQHNRVKSNVDWLYSYRRTAASFRLEYAF